MPNRRRMLGFLFLLSVVTYLDRVNISITSPSIKSEFGLDRVQMGLIFSAFVVGYTIFQIPAGWFGDRFGHKKSLTFALIGWSLFTALSGWAGKGFLTTAAYLLPAFWIMRFMVGVGEAGAYPCANGMIGDSFGPGERALAAGVMFAGIGTGSAFTPPFVAWIVVHLGWRSAFYISAAIGILLAVSFHIWMPEHSTPASHRDQPGFPAPRPVKPKTPWKLILTNSQVWVMVTSIFFFGYVTYVYYFWFFPYLVDVRKISMLRSSFFTAMPFLTMAICAPLGGALSDRLIPRIGRASARRRVVMTGLIAAAILIPCGAIIPGAYPAVACLSLAAGGVYLAISCYFATAIEIFPDYSATVSGTMNTGAGVGGIIAPILTPWVASHFGWVSALSLAGAFSLIAALLWKFIGSPDLASAHVRSAVEEPA
jgi:ACS family glucarate transporter-like MFS transporter